MQLKEEKLQKDRDLMQAENENNKLRSQIATFMAAQPGQAFDCLCKRCDAQFATAEDLRQHKHNCDMRQHMRKGLGVEVNSYFY